MLDLKFIRENPDKVKQGIANKNEKDRMIKKREDVNAQDMKKKTDIIRE